MEQGIFTKMIDSLVEYSNSDPELADGIRWIDGQAQKKGIDFYDMVYEVLMTHDSRQRAKEWMKDKSYM